MRSLIHDELHVPEFALNEGDLEERVTYPGQEVAHHVKLLEERRYYFSGA